MYDVRVTTLNSVWLFRMEDKLFMRMPRVETPGHPEIPYSGTWDSYASIEFGQPVPFRGAVGTPMVVNLPDGNYLRTTVIDQLDEVIQA